VRAEELGQEYFHEHEHTQDHDHADGHDDPRRASLRQRGRQNDRRFHGRSQPASPGIETGTSMIAYGELEREV